jgi:hypothetical protein
MKQLFLFFFCFFLSIGFAQNKHCHPRKLKRSISKSVSQMSDNELHLIRTITLDSFLNIQYQKRIELPPSHLKPLKKILLDKNCRAFNTEELEFVFWKYQYFTLNKKDTCISDLLQPIIVDYQKMIDRLKINQTADSINGVYIPKDLDDCFSQLNSFWNDSVKLSIKSMKEDEFVAESHFGIGMWMRNNWGLWSSSRLSSYFSDLSVFHPDDMSGIILRSYHRKLNNRDIKLEEQIRLYQEYWEKND